MIELSVVLPMFRSQHIGWLPFESLVRQTDILFEWELIIAEELEHQPFGEHQILEYKKKLEDLGCVRFKYIGLEKWITLAEKLYLLKENCDKETGIFMWHSADYYSAPKRLITSYEIFKEESPHVLLPIKAIYYDISNECVALHDSSMKGHNVRQDDVVGKSWSYNVIKSLPKVKRRSGVDGFLFRECKKITGGQGTVSICRDESDNWKYALSTHGLNSINHRRGNWLKTKKPPFRECPVDINTTIPVDVLTRLKECKKFIKKHKKGFPG